MNVKYNTITYCKIQLNIKQALQNQWERTVTADTIFNASGLPDQVL